MSPLKTAPLFAKPGGRAGGRKGDAGVSSFRIGEEAQMQSEVAIARSSQVLSLVALPFSQPILATIRNFFVRYSASVSLATRLLAGSMRNRLIGQSLGGPNGGRAGFAEGLKPLSMLFFFVSGSKSLYGTETRFVEMMDAFQRNDARVLAIESYPSLERISGKVRYPCREVAVILGRKRRFAASGLNLMRTLSNGVKACFGNGEFDLVISGERNFMNVFPAFVISRVIRKPLVIVIHHAVRDDYIGRKDLTTEMRTNGLVNGFVLSWGRELHRLVCRRAELVVAVSEATKKEFCAAYGILPERVAVTGNGSRLKANPTIGTRVRAVDVTYLGRFTASKGAFLLPSIWKAVSEKRPGARLVIAGGQGSELLEMRALVTELRLENVEVLGYLTDDEASALLAESRLFVLPSTREGFSIVTADAMASGCACVVSDLPALRGVFGDAVTYVPVGDASKFAVAILSMLANEGKSNELSALSVDFARRFSWDSIAKRELALYEALATRYR